MVVHTCTICLKQFKKKSAYIDHVENKKKPCKPIILNNTKILQNPPKNSEIFQNENNNDFFSNNEKQNVILNKEFNCNYCKKKFSTNFNLNKHVKYNCKVKKIDEEKKEIIFNNLLEKELLLKNVKLLQKNNENLQKQNNFLLKELRKLENKFDKKIEKQSEKYDNQMKKIINKNCNNTNNTNNYTQNNIIIPSDKLVEFGKEDLTKIDIKDLLNNIKSRRITGTSIFIENEKF